MRMSRLFLAFACIIAACTQVPPASASPSKLGKASGVIIPATKQTTSVTGSTSGYGTDPTPPVVSGITYDTSIGNGVDANGFAALPLRVGAHRYYVNSAIGSDANSCATAQTAATPKASLASGRDCLTQGAGDQELVAEGTTYAERLPIFTYKDGFSYTYPTVLQSYNPAAPLDETQMGRATANRPTVTGDEPGGSPWINPCCDGTVVTGLIAVRGFSIDPGNITDESIGLQLPGDGILFENNIIAHTSLSFNNNAGEAVRHHWILRNNALYGSFSTSCGTCGQQFYADGSDSVTLEDNVFWHSGWKVGAARTDDYTIGGTKVFAHPFYIQDPVDVIVRRNLIADGGSDGGSERGNAIDMANLRIDNPINPGIGNGTGEDGSRPLGMDEEVSNNAIIGGSAVTGGCNDCGIISIYGRSGSFASYNLLARSSTFGSSAFITGSTSLTGSTIPSYMDYNHNVSYLWSPSGFTKSNDAAQTFPALVHTSYSNNIWDDPASGTNTNVSSATFANAYTSAAFFAATGYTDKTTFINYAIAHPEAHIQRAAHDLLMAGYGITSPPLRNLTTYATYVIGSPDHSWVLGVKDGSTLTYSGFPSGYSLHSSTRGWTYDGTGSATSGTGTITETASDGITTHNTSVPWTVNAAPLLTSVSATATGATTATLAATTDTGNGTLYWFVATRAPGANWPFWGVVRWASSSNGSQAISSTGAKTVSLTGLTTGTPYYGYLLHVNGSGFQSIVAKAGPFTPTGATGFTWDNTSGGGNITFTNGNLTATESGGSSGLGKGTVAGTGYYIVNVDNVGVNMRIGLANATATAGGLGIDGNSVGYDSGGAITWAGGFPVSCATYTTGDVIKVAWDATTVSFYKNNTLTCSYGSSGLGAVKPAFSAGASSGGVTLTDYTHWN